MPGAVDILDPPRRRSASRSLARRRVSTSEGNRPSPAHG